MNFSLIQGTIGEVDKLTNFLYHLNRQTYRSFELIVVDQNADDRLTPLLARYQDRFKIIYLHSIPGLSKARNMGITHARGKTLAFPDDDCWYTDGLLQSLAEKFDNNPGIDGFVGRIINEKGANSAPFDNQAGYITKYNVWKRANSNSLFLRTKVVEDVGEFDVTLGLGSETIWQSSEDIDYPLRCLEQGYLLFYDPSIAIFHPNIYSGNYEALSKRAFKYGAGMGRVWKKHRYPAWFGGYYLLRPLIGACLSLMKSNFPQAKTRWQSFRGRWVGWNSR